MVLTAALMIIRREDDGQRVWTWAGADGVRRCYDVAHFPAGMAPERAAWWLVGARFGIVGCEARLWPVVKKRERGKEGWTHLFVYRVGSLASRPQMRPEPRLQGWTDAVAFDAMTSTPAVAASSRATWTRYRRSGEASLKAPVGARAS